MRINEAKRAEIPPEILEKLATRQAARRRLKAAIEAFDKIMVQLPINEDDLKNVTDNIH